ncbi:zinc ribbon domain-containing protein [Crenobacter sp. SG2303]|uniref:Zinc ribbon domain-containing protein n=1 Tax=Crenobacter oryzisoli TaxID=3056844 RepID=A0ABT7XMV1_9NEIS|nr:zinc ribbon domain-containing protein [Crenobacter sp. SG2303]MDN0075101.1 zinc ribbon domain-containing protein [Crenobacter sp. SG2303]
MVTQCSQCKAQNPDGKRFCSDCGGPLDPAFFAIRDLMGAVVKDQVRDVLKETYKDNKVIEVEVTEAIAARLFEWAKMLAFLVGIPITVFLLVLGVLGIRTYSDFTSQVKTAQTEIADRLVQAQKRADKLKTEGDNLNAEYDKLRTQLAESKELATQVRSLSDRVDKIGEKLGFTSSSNLTPEVRRRLEAAFGKFQLYLQNLGYQAKGGDVQLDIRETMTSGAISYYDPAGRKLVIDKKYSSVPDVLFREYMHAVLYSKGGVPSDPEGKLWAYYGIESGLATYFPCSFNNNPRFAQINAAATWNLSKHRSFNELRAGIGFAMADGAEIWGGAFWEMRELLGQATADKLLFDAWFRLRAEEVGNDRGAAFVRQLLEVDRATGSTHRAQIINIFAGRQLTIHGSLPRN